MNQLKKIYLDKTKDIEMGNNLDYWVRKMKVKLHEEFDEIWLKHEKGEVPYREWEKALGKWLKMEQL